MSEPTQEELLQAVKDSLVKDGRFDKFKAELRTAIISVLNKNTSEQKAPEIPEETKLMNELIREYLEWNGYRYAEQMFTTESGQPTEKMPRDVMTSKLGVIDDSRTTKIPLLYFILADFQKRN